MRRTRTTWAAYLLLALFAYVETIVGPAMPFLRSKLDLSYTVASVHFAAFASGAIVAGFTGDRVLRQWGRRNTLWGGMAGFIGGIALLGLSPHVVGTLAGVLAMGLLGTWFLVSDQAVLADLHSAHRTQALAESNVAASSAAVLAPLSVGGFARFGPSWEAALLMAVPVLAVLYGAFRQAPVRNPARRAHGSEQFGGLPRSFWILFAVLFLTMSVEWCMAYWGAEFLDTVVGLERANAATAMSLFFGAMIAGRMAGARLAHRFAATRLLKAALVLALCGFPVFWLAPNQWLSLAGLFVAGAGIANFYPLTVAAATGVAGPMIDRAASRLAISGGAALLTLPLAVGALADAAGLRFGLGVIVPLLICALALVVWVSRIAPGQEPI